MNNIEDFFKYTAQTTPSPYLIEVESASGLYITDRYGKKYMDMIAGVAVNNFGHCHPKIVKAISQQVKQYMHVMVYGEYVQKPHLNFCKKLVELLPDNLNCVYTVNSGTEANEVAIKLVKRLTNRTEIVAFSGAYHGNTHGSMSVSDNEKKKAPFRPLLPNVRIIEHNNIDALQYITKQTAGVILETVQSDAGIRVPNKTFLTALRKRCYEVGALLILDEIQCGIGRTGRNFAFEHFDITPDILTLGKAIGGGLPIGVVVAAKEHLYEFAQNPILGHITTFGGNPVIATAALATLEILEKETNLKEVERLGKLLETIISSSNKVKEVRRIGMMFAFDMNSTQEVEQVVKHCLNYGLISFWFLSHPYSFRLAPPLNITEDEVVRAGEIILKAFAKIDEN